MGQNGDNSLMDGEKEKDLLKYKFKEQLVEETGFKHSNGNKKGLYFNKSKFNKVEGSQPGKKKMRYLQLESNH